MTRTLAAVVIAVVLVAALALAYDAGRVSARLEALAAEGGDVNSDPCPAYVAR